MTVPVAVFLLVYLGMALGKVPGLALDRTGIALLGMIVLVGTNTMTLADVGQAVDMSTIALLFALMIISAQFEQAGFYDWIAARVTGSARRPRTLLAAIIAFAGVLSAILTNDVVVFALTPPLCAGLMALRIDPRPYLIGVAAAANGGSAATLIGNPQNILIGQAGELDFWRYLLVAAPPSIAALAVTFAVIVATWKLAAPQALGETGRAELDRYQLAKAVLAVVALICMFATRVPHEVSALAIAGVLLLSRRLSSRDMIGAVDWHLLLLFTSLFAVTEAFARTGIAQDALASLESMGLLPQTLTVMAPLTMLAANTIGNVPAVVVLMKLLPDLSAGVLTGLALLSTFAGNLLLTGSLCNIIVAERAASQGVTLGFGDFARSGLLIGTLSILIAVAWLMWMNVMAV